MSELDIEQLLRPITDDSPCGPEIEDDPAYLAFEVRLAGTPERQMGDVIEPARPPNWREIRQEAVQLLSRSRDLRLELALIQALLHTQGVVGLAEGLALLHRTLDNDWDELHPRLDPEDNLDPTLRINILRGLSDYETLLKPLAHCPLLSSQALGRYNLRQIRQAQGRELQDSEQPIELSQIRAVALDMDADALRGVYQSALTSQNLLVAIDAVISTRAGLGNGPDLEPLRTQLKEISQALEPFVAERGDPPGPDQLETDSAAAQSSVLPRTGAATGEIASREDVVRAIDAICRYYARQEPSSPVPLLLKRARGLVDKDFLDIIKDLAADSLGQVELVAGKGPEKS